MHLLMRWLFAKDKFVLLKQYTAGYLAETIGARVDGLSDMLGTGCSSLADAVAGDITFMVNAKYSMHWKESAASIAIVPNGIQILEHDASKRTLLWVDNVEVAMATVLSLFAREDDLPELGVHTTAVISSSASIGAHVRIGPFVVVADDAVIADNVSLHSGTRIGKGACIGAGTILYTGVVIGQYCRVGEDCILHGNVVLGTDGFGYCANEEQTHLIKIQHSGNVEVGNNVEIGSNSCIDRGKFSPTVIGSGTKIDNLVQVGHNCLIGENCAISATTAIAGSVVIGNWVQIGGNVGISPHCVIGDGAKIGAKSGVMNDIPAGEKWLGLPASPVRDALRQWSSTRKLPRIIADIHREQK